MATARRSGYRDYTADGTYWTVRKRGRVYWVTRIDRSKGGYDWVEIWGGYNSAGAAAGAAAQLAYGQAKRDAVEALRSTLHDALETVGLGAAPLPPPVKPEEAAALPPLDGEDEEEAE